MMLTLCQVWALQWSRPTYPPQPKHWMNGSCQSTKKKTEFAHTSSDVRIWVTEEWRLTKKLGSLLLDKKEVQRRTHLAAGSEIFIVYLDATIICQRKSASIQLSSYQSYVIAMAPIGHLTTESTVRKVEALHRQQSRRVLEITNTKRISKATQKKGRLASRLSNCWSNMVVVLQCTKAVWRHSSQPSYCQLLEHPSISFNIVRQTLDSINAAPATQLTEGGTVCEDNATSQETEEH